MKNLINLHLIKTDDDHYKFTMLVNSLPFTDKVCHSSMEEAIKAAVKFAELLEENALLTIEQIKEWEK